MAKISNKRDVNKIAYLFALTYMVSYITRINYGAVISEMVTATGMSRTLLSMALTGSFITYGAGQIISGICGDNFDPKSLVICGLFASCAMNVIIPFCQTPYHMLFIWSINGFAQAFMWPPIVKLMTALLSSDDYKSACAKVSWGSSAGTIIVYLLSPLLITFASWKAVFFVSALCGLVMIFIWAKACPSVSLDKTISVREENIHKGSVSAIFTPVMLFIMLGIILQGILRDGVTTWMPSYISETYKLGNEISILTNVVMPIFSIICFQISTYLYVHKIKNPLSCAALFFGIGTLSAVALYSFTGQNAVFSVLVSAILTGCMHGVNLMLICMIPPFFEKTGKVSTVSGILNSCTYIGSALSAYGIAVLSEQAGWTFTLFVWIGIALVGTLICAICAKPWKRYEEA